MTTSTTIDDIKDIARDVFRALGSGHSEAAYQKAMEVGLRLGRFKFEAQRAVELTYRDHFIATENLDLLVERDSDKVIVELKAAQQELGLPEEQQLRNYMKGLGIDRGLLINFPQPGRTKKDADGSRTVEPDIRPVMMEEPPRCATAG